MSSISKSNEIITIYQKNWGFAEANSDKPILQTGSFGPCYAVIVMGGNYAALAHIDDCTDIDSLKDVFDEFVNQGIGKKDLKVTIAGGWKECDSSHQWGEKLARFVLNYGITFANIERNHMYQKDTPLSVPVPLEIVPLYYFYGVQVDATNKTVSFFGTGNPDLEAQQNLQTKKLRKQYTGSKLDTLSLPLTRIKG